MTKIREISLTKGMSYTGYGIKATKKNPIVTVDDATAVKLLATGYFADCGTTSPKAEAEEEPSDLVKAAEPVSEPAEPAIPDVDYEKLSHMTKAELAEVAEANNIDIEKCRTKADILETISVACGGNYTMIELQRK